MFSDSKHNNKEQGMMSGAVLLIGLLVLFCLISHVYLLANNG
ncbi:hypothetical protein [Flavobacterium sp.]|nr:hypothetical protein [Flavobacterium sp.]